MKKLLFISLFLCNGIIATEKNPFIWKPFSQEENDELDNCSLDQLFQESNVHSVNRFITINQDEQNFLNHFSQSDLSQEEAGSQNDPFLNELQEIFSLNNDADDDKDNDDINAKDLNIACSALHEDSIKKNYDNDSDNELDEETHSAEPSALNVDDTIEKKSKKIFECTYKHTCRKIFDTEQHLKDHIVAANNTKPFKCFDRQCRGREEFNRYNFLAIHLKRHHKIDVDICLVCSIKFKTDRDLLLHKRTLWHKESLKKIYENDTAYIKEMNENNHELLSQQNQKDDDADDCFAKKRPKYGPRLFLCNYKEEHPCQKNFPSQYALIQHLNEHDNNVKNEKLRCKTCKHFFATSWALNRHTKSAVHQKNIETLKEAKSLLSNTSED